MDTVPVHVNWRACMATPLSGVSHRVGRVLGFFSSRRNWDSSTPNLQARVSPPPPRFRGRGTLACVERGGWGSPNSNEGTYTVVLFIYAYFVGLADYKARFKLPPQITSCMYRRYSTSTHAGRAIIIHNAPLCCNLL
jgi:hypothetical protein